jgi:hypothetical protein
MNACAKTVEGTFMKFVMSLELPDGFTMDDVDFKFTFYIRPNRTKEFTKAEMVRIDEGNYSLVLDTSGMGHGRILYQAEVTMPDGSKEIIRCSTDEILSEKL